jgi:hypothetical protein
MRRRRITCPALPALGMTLALGMVTLLWTATAFAQVEGSLSVYGAANGRGYLQPLKEALGSGLAAGLYNTARVESGHFRVRLEANAMLMSFGSSDRTFNAHTESYFPSDQTAQAPTVVGSTQSTSVTDPGTGAVFTFPGGLDLSRLALAAPQVVIGGVKGTELMVRYLTVQLGKNSDIGDLSLFGIGARHSLSQYMHSPKIDVAALVFYQSLNLGTDFIDSSLLSFGVQAGRRFRVLEPYVGVALNSQSFEMRYDAQQGGSSTRQDIKYDTDTSLGATVGAALHLKVVHLNGQFEFAHQTTFAFGLSLGM